MDFDTLYTRWLAARCDWDRQHGRVEQSHFRDDIECALELMFDDGITADSLTDELARGALDGLFSADELRYLITVTADL